MTKYEYKTIKENSYVLEIKKSKFIARGFCVNTILDCKQTINQIKKKYHNAKHNVYAFALLNGISKSSDDKEPSGTAGIQVLSAINNNNLKNTLIIVTRYFGGILLGTGGLSRAYYSSANLLIKNSEIIEKFTSEIINLEFNYKDYNKILNSKLFDINISKVEFFEKVRVEFKIKKDKIEEFNSKLKNIINYQKKS